jgi:hypothetical protein
LFYLNSLSEILVCGAHDILVIVFILDLYLLLFVLLNLFSYFSGVGFCFLGGIHFITRELVNFHWNIIRLKSRSTVTSFLFDWMSLLFTAFVFISSFVILYSSDITFSDLSIC